MKLFTEWFKNSQHKNKKKLEFYYVPFMKNERVKKHIMEKINIRRATSHEKPEQLVQENANAGQRFFDVVAQEALPIKA